jgi:hypothetical protein
MIEFMPEPTLILENKDDLAALLDTKPEAEIRLHRHRIKSRWLIGLIDEIAASGRYPYNATVNKLACERLGYPPKSEAEYSREGTALSWLIYNAQNFRRSDQFIAAGYTPFTPAMLDEAYTIGAKVEVAAETLLGGSAVIVLTPKDIDGKLYAVLPRKRTQHLPPMGQPAKIIKAGKRVKKSVAAA